MVKSMYLTDGYGNGDDHDVHLHHHHHQRSISCSSIRDVSYSCGSCGYELNLNSSNRNTSTIGSKYGKSIKRGKISFYNIDESRFNQVDELQCIPYFISRHSLGLLRPKTKLLCRKCGNNVGSAYDDYNTTSGYSLSSDGSDSVASSNENSRRKKYNIRLRALQPLSTEESNDNFAPDV